MSAAHQKKYFVSAATVAAELHKAMLVAREISLTASNARALALRAGHGAAGFRALTEFIDELARKTVNASKAINAEAIQMSRTASKTARTHYALCSFEVALEKGKDAIYIASIRPAYERTKQQHRELESHFHRQIYQLTERLNELGRELRIATVLAAMSRVEASASGREFEDALNAIAENVVRSAEKIKNHVKKSQRMFTHDLSLDLVDKIRNNTI